MGQYGIRMRMEAGIGLRNDVDLNGEGMKIDRNMEGADLRCRWAG